MGPRGRGLVCVAGRRRLPFDTRTAHTHTFTPLPPLKHHSLVVSVADDDEAVAVANDCPFGLGSAVFSGSQARARAIGARLAAGMTSINDFATTYMCQSLPFGGVKHSGFGRFAGVEGLRALTVPKAVAEDRQADVRGQERGWQ